MQTPSMDTQSLYATTPQISSRSSIQIALISARPHLRSEIDDFRDVVFLQTSTPPKPKKTFLLPPLLLPTVSYNRSLNRMPFATTERRRALQEDVCGGSITLPGRRMSMTTARGTRTVRRLGFSELPVLSRCMAVRAKGGKICDRGRCQRASIRLDLPGHATTASKSPPAVH